jgi:acyl-CoA dehydrogenase
MAWDFSVEPEFEEKLEWIRTFRDKRIEPLDLLYPGRNFYPLDDDLGPVVRALKQQVRDQGLWAPHLGPELGGRGYGQVKLALINEILGASQWAPVIFGTAAPDTGNAEIIARYGTEEQKKRYLEPLLEGECFSCFSMTEPHGGSDPTMFTTRAVRDGDDWILNGRKFFSSNARTAEFVIVMAVTNPDVSPYKGMSMFLVPSDTPGVRVERHIGLMGEGPDEGMHALIAYEGARLPAEALLGGEGQAFAIAQTRLGGGRVHHAMRVVGQCQKALDMMAERAISRETHGSRLADKQLVQADLADSYAELTQFRLFVLYTAWQIDKYQDYKRVKKDIAAIKFLMPKVMHDIVYRSMHLHGALGVSNEMPFGDLWNGAAMMAVVDGPSEVHKVTVAKEVLRGREPAPGLWPTEHLPARREWARHQMAALGLKTQRLEIQGRETTS